MILSPRAFRFLKVNGAVLIVFFFVFGLTILISAFIRDNIAAAFIGGLLTLAGIIVVGLHWMLLYGVQSRAIIIQEHNADSSILIRK